MVHEQELYVFMHLAHYTFIQSDLCCIKVFFTCFPVQKYQNIPKSVNIYLKSKMTQDIKVLFSEKLSKCSEFSLKTRNKYLPVGSEKESWFPFNLIFITQIC